VLRFLSVTYFYFQLVIHVGVSSYANKITLETCAHKEGYVRCDHFGNKPSKGTECIAKSLESCIQVGINVENICDYLNTNLPVKACVSENAGRYDYIVYLHIKKSTYLTFF
jgi:pyrrolidone-carboxylate peptidase